MDGEFLIPEKELNQLFKEPTKLHKFKRALRYFWQRRTRGWDDTDTWHLGITLSRWLAPRLKRFKELNNGHPPDFTEQEWDAKLDQMILAFELFANPDDWNFDDEVNEENHKKVQEGLNLFSEWFYDLWW